MDPESIEALTLRYGLPTLLSLGAIVLIWSLRNATKEAIGKLTTSLDDVAKVCGGLSTQTAVLQRQLEDHADEDNKMLDGYREALVGVKHSVEAAGRRTEEDQREARDSRRRIHEKLTENSEGIAYLRGQRGHRDADALETKTG